MIGTFRSGAETIPVTVTFYGVPLTPRDDRVLRVLIIARISTVHQDPRSLDDQRALCERYVRDHYPGEIHIEVIAGRGSGEFLDRQELLDAETAVESRRFDLVVVEDLGRVCRRNRAIDFIEGCEDAASRMIAINDNIDTARDWRMNAFFASFKHEMSNKDTAARIRRSLRNRFVNGGVVMTFPYGYVKPPGASSDADVRKDPAAEPVIDELFSRLEAGATYAEAADWLNAQGVPTGEWAANPKWDGRMVGRLVHNPILKGVRVRNVKVTRRVNKSGRRRSVAAPPGERLERSVSHLAFVDAARYDRLVARLDADNSHYARGRAAARPDERAGVSKKRTVWPGQHAVCGVCGQLMYWGGHGQAGRMMCSGARDYACWNAATFDGSDSARRLAAAVLSAAEDLPGFDAAFRKKVEAAAADRRSGREDALRKVEANLRELGRELDNLSDAVAKMGFSPTLATSWPRRKLGRIV